MSFSLASGLIFTALLAPIAFFLAAAKFLDADENCWTLFGLCFGVTPAAISRLITWTMYVNPSQPAWYYVAIVVAVFAMLAIIGAPRLGLLSRMTCDLVRWFLDNVVLILAASGLGIVAVYIVFAPRTSVWVADTLSWWMSNWNSEASGWVGVMPPSATFVLIALGLAWVLRTVSNRLRKVNEPPSQAIRFGLKIVIGAMLVAVSFTLAILVLGSPLYENDAMQYFKVATLMFEAKSLQHYPVVPAAADGMYAISSHPLGHYGVVIWGFLIAGAPVPGAAKAVVLIWWLVAFVGIWIALQSRTALTILSAMLLIATTPAYFLQSMSSGIDGQRVALMLFAVLWTVEAGRQNTWQAWMFAGLAAGLALNSHSQTGLLVPLMIGAGLLCVRCVPFARRIKAGIAIGLFSVAIGGEQYVLNLIAFGTPINNDLPLWNTVPALRFDEWKLTFLRSNDIWTRLSSGPLYGFTHWYFFGFSWWLALLGLVVYAPVIRSDQRLAALTLTLVFSFSLLIIFFGFTGSGASLANNYRYALNTECTVAILAGLLVGGLLEPDALSA